MPFDAHDGAQNFATAGPQALVHHLHGVLGEKEVLVTRVYASSPWPLSSPDEDFSWLPFSARPGRKTSR